MRVLYLGGTGEISYACVQAGAALGQQIAVFNRGHSDESLPAGVQLIRGDLSAPDCFETLSQMSWDVVCQFCAYLPHEVQRDIEFFSGRTAQYVFISSASAYRKSLMQHVITEQTPLENPHLQYSRNKIECEELLMNAHRAGKLPVTIVRPSHTYRCRFPCSIGDGDHWAWRMQQGRGVIVHGDGMSLWTYTHADDFAHLFVRLLGNPAALGEAFHITQHLKASPWDRLMHATAAALGVEPKLVHVPTDTLVRYNREWAGPLRGDKTWSVLFDNSKVLLAAGEYTCRIDPEEGLQRVAEHYRKRAARFKPDADTDELFERITRDVTALGHGAGN